MNKFNKAINFYKNNDNNLEPLDFSVFVFNNHYETYNDTWLLTYDYVIKNREDIILILEYLNDLYDKEYELIEDKYKDTSLFRIYDDRGDTTKSEIFEKLYSFVDDSSVNENLDFIEEITIYLPKYLYK